MVVMTNSFLLAARTLLSFERGMSNGHTSALRPCPASQSHPGCPPPHFAWCPYVCMLSCTPAIVYIFISLISTLTGSRCSRLHTLQKTTQHSVVHAPLHKRVLPSHSIRAFYCLSSQVFADLTLAMTEWAFW